MFVQVAQHYFIAAEMCEIFANLMVISQYYFGFSRRTKTYHQTHVASYLVCLLLSNVLQAIGTIMNARWVEKGGVYNGGFCSFQGGLKNAANVGTAFW